MLYLLWAMKTYAIKKIIIQQSTIAAIAFISLLHTFRFLSFEIHTSNIMCIDMTSRPKINIKTKQEKKTPNLCCTACVHIVRLYHCPYSYAFIIVEYYIFDWTISIDDWIGCIHSILIECNGKLISSCWNRQQWRWNENTKQ